MNEKEKYHKLIEATGTGFVILDDKGLVLDANQTYVNLTGRQTFAEIRGHGVDEWAAPYEKEKNLAMMKQCFEQGFIQRLEIDYIDPSGKITPVEIDATVAQTDTSVQILSLARDITERKRAEEETRLRFEVSQVLAGKETEDEVLDALIQQTGLYPQAQVMIFTSELVEGETYSVARRIESFDSELAALVEPGTRFSASQSQMIEKSKSSAGDEFVSPNLPADERADPFFRDLARQMGTVSMAVVPIKIGNNLLGSISLSSRAEGYFDTPKLHLYRALAEQGARALQAAQLRDQVRANEDKYRKLIETTDTGFVIIDGQGNVLDANQNYVNLTGYSTLDEIKGRNVAAWTAPYEAEKNMAAVKQCFEQGFIRRLEIDYIDPGGKITPVEIDATVAQTNTGVQILSLVRDITERKLAETERDRLQQEVIEAQQRAIAELSTPVIPIMDRIIVMPLIGSVDSLRARDITRTLLAGITQHRAKVVILDVTGVGIMDTGIVNHLNKTIQAARLKGAQTIVTGVSDAVAEAIVDLGIDWSGVTTLADLQGGLTVALGSLGVKLQITNGR